MSKFKYSIFFVLLFSCSNTLEPEKFKTLHIETIKYGEQGSVLKIYSDTTQNVFIEIYDTISSNKYIQAVNGCGNCSFTDTFVKIVRFTNDSNCREYIISPIVNNSTFGAEFLFVVWHDGVQWNTTRLPIQRYEIHDLNKDGISEIIDFSLSQEGISYNFNRGNLVKYR